MPDLSRAALAEAGDVYLLHYRFWRSINVAEEHECWEWTKKKDTYGSGIFSFQIKGVKHSFRAHRIAYVMEHEEETLWSNDIVLHTCENPACCNPRHLEKKTRKEYQSTKSVGRAGHDKWLNYSALTKEEKQAILEGVEKGLTETMLRRRFKISKAIFQHVVRERKV